MKGKSLNYKVLRIFAPVLILTGVLGFVIPEEKALTSGAAAYNVFHLIFGAIGLLVLLLKNENSIRLFNIGFGLLDLYQAFAAFTNLFPIRYFQWTRVDDALHIVIGAGLVLVGIYGFRKERRF
ncbi:MAG: hypothetical protein LH472_07485 [Pyrinomonadaceae bacterium]|nr:hypothetical protein [Pyrinomonadaceae bacterium]